MTVHKHVMVLDGSFYFCEGCLAVVEMVPSLKRIPGGTKVIASARVRDYGIGGFGLDEMIGLSRLWLACLMNQATGQPAASCGGLPVGGAPH
jgi:hypothetical protein